MGIVNIFGLLKFRAIKRMTYISLKSHKFERGTPISTVTKGGCYYLIFYFALSNFQRKVKKSEHSKISHSKKLNIEFCSEHKHHSSKLFIHARNCPKLPLFCTLLMMIQAIYPNKTYLRDREGHYQMFSQILCFRVLIVIFSIAWKHIY